MMILVTTKEVLGFEMFVVTWANDAGTTSKSFWSEYAAKNFASRLSKSV